MVTWVLLAIFSLLQTERKLLVLQVWQIWLHDSPYSPASPWRQVCKPCGGP